MLSNKKYKEPRINVNQEYFPYPDKKDMIIVLVYLIAAIIGSYITDVAFIALALLSAMYRRWTFKALTLMLLLIFINPGLLILGQSHSLVLRWFIIGVTVVRYLFKSRKGKNGFKKWEVALISFSLFCLVSASITSINLQISFLKLLVFTLTFIAMGRLVVEEKEVAIDRWLMAIAVVIIGGSLLLLPFPVGRFRNAIAFQGVFNQPNAFGVYLAPFSAWLLGLVLNCKNRKNAIFAGSLLVATLAEMYLSLSRTSLLAFTGAVTISFFIIIIKGHKNYGIILKTSISILFTIIVTYWTLDTFAPKNVMVEMVSSFMYKGKEQGRNDNNTDLLSSRQDLMDNSMRKFKEKPFFGNGFGMPSIAENIETGKVMGIPVTASVEKGTIVTALLEETGIFGTMFFIIFMFQFTKRIVLRGNFIANAVLWSAFLISFGEMVFFSPGGLGLHVYIFMAFSRWNTLPAVQGA